MKEQELFTLRSLLVGSRPKKRQKLDLTPILFATMKISLGKTKTKLIKVLLDSGASSSLVCKDLVKKLRQKRSPAVRWKTAAGQFLTSSTCDIEFALTELQEKRTMKNSFHVVDDTMLQYNMIIGREVLSHLKIDLEFSTNSIKWDGATVPFRDSNSTAADAFAVRDSSTIREAANRVKKIQDAKYKPADLHEVAQSSSHLNADEKNQ